MHIPFSCSLQNHSKIKRNVIIKIILLTLFNIICIKETAYIGFIIYI